MEDQRIGDALVKLGWYIARLRNMAPAEIAHRLVEALHRRSGRRMRHGWDAWPASALTPLPGFAERLATATPGQRQKIAAAAEASLAGRFSALGRDWPQRAPQALYPPELWRLDPVTGSLWPGPETYCFDIDFRHDGSRGDIKYVWEVNRLQFLVPLAAHHRLTADPRALAAIVDGIESWSAANPPFQGVGWASGIEIALRAISLLLVHALLGDRLPAASQARISSIVSASRHWLERFPSLHSSANNHRIAELAGLHLIALAGMGAPARWGAELAREIGLQILPDGSGAEQTPTYAAFSAELALLCLAAGESAGKPLPHSVGARLGLFAGFINWLGTAPPLAYGDDDEGRAITDGTVETDYPRSVATAIAGQIGTPGPTHVPDFRGLLLGQPAELLPAPAGLRTFPQGGLSVWHGALGDHSARLSFDHGPLGYLSIAAHGHADALTFTLAIDGRPVFVDPGTYLYGSGGPWRRWFRSTAAHNTLNIAGHDQSQMAGAFNWLHHARARLVDSATTPDGFSLEASHDGYVGRYARTHIRRVGKAGDTITIEDRLTGGDPIDAELVFQLAPGLEAVLAGSEVTIRTAEGEPLCTLLLPGPAITLERGTGTPGVGGHVSPRFGQVLPAIRIAWRGPVGPAGVTTRIRPHAESA